MPTNQNQSKTDVSNIADKMRTDGMNYVDIIKALHGKLGQVKEAVGFLIEDAKAAKLNEKFTHHEANVVKPTEKQQGINRESLTALYQDRRSSDAANNLNTNVEQMNETIRSASDNRKKFIDELKRLLTLIGGAQKDLLAKVEAGNINPAEIKSSIATIATSLKKCETEMPPVIDTDKTVLENTRKLYARIRETAIAFSVALTEVETPKKNY